MEITSSSMFGLIGYPLGHSFSKDFFSRKFAKENIRNSGYHNFSIENISMFPRLVNMYPQLIGLNVTIPYKEKIIPYLHQLDPIATEIGAVNTIKFESHKNKKILKGFNTDAYGFSKSLEEILPLNRETVKALILGTGGASKAVAYSLKLMNIPIEFVSTSSKTALAYNELSGETMKSCSLIINTTPLGTFPDIEEYPPIPYEYINEHHILFDLVYNPAQSEFLRRGKERGATISNGLKMLEYQALKSWEIWNSK